MKKETKIKPQKDVKKKDLKTKTKKDVKKKEKVKKEGYLKQVRKELKLVKWPTFKEVLKYTISTIVFVMILCAFFLLLNLLMSVIKGWFL